MYNIHYTVVQYKQTDYNYLYFIYALIVTSLENAFYYKGLQLINGAKSAELWFTYGAISPTITTLVSPPAQPPPHGHLWEVSGRMSRTAVQDVLCLLCRGRQPLIMILCAIL